jgi:16S rRNA (guanine(527)-N(7))-methyltransferase RsmG
MNFNKALWRNFAEKHALTDNQVQQFQQYYTLLKAWSEDINLTTIVDEEGVLAYHFEDSLNLAQFYDVAACKGIADIGTGAGLPGIPLKIKFPHIPVVLVEVIQKKVVFLEEVIKELQLTDIEICSLDWRTFLRKTEYPVDLVCARASLRPDELIRMFQESSPYKNADLVYWASHDWALEERETKFFVREEKYIVGDKKRKYMFLKNK